MPTQPAPYYVLDNVLMAQELLWIYHRLLQTTKWSLGRQSVGSSQAQVQFSSFPGLTVEHQDMVMDEFLSGYFRGLVFRIRKQVKEEHALKLPDHVMRVALGAKNAASHTDMHRDDAEGSWTILGLLNPVWNAEDGGEVRFEDPAFGEETVLYKPGRFIVFQSHLLHNGGFVKGTSLANWRISLNIVLSRTAPWRDPH